MSLTHVCAVDPLKDFPNAPLLGVRATILRRIDWLSGLIGALLWRLGRLRRASGSCPAGWLARAGLRWCGGWRRMNFRGSHDQAQNQAEGCDPLNRLKDRQARFPQAIGASIVEASSAARHK